MVVEMLVHASLETDDCNDCDTRRECRDNLNCGGSIGLGLRQRAEMGFNDSLSDGCRETCEDDLENFDPGRLCSCQTLSFG